MGEGPYLEYARVLRDFLLVVCENARLDPCICDLFEESFNPFLSFMHMLVHLVEDALETAEQMSNTQSA